MGCQISVCGTTDTVWCGPIRPYPSDGGGCGLVTCQSAGANCGQIGDGCGDMIPCGTCPSKEFCLEGVCVADAGPDVCVPTTCAQLGIQCGLAGDGCGGLLECGLCAPPTECGGGGVAGQCGYPACSCSNGTQTWSDFPSTPSSCSQAVEQCFPPEGAPDAGCIRVASTGGTFGVPGDSCRDDAACSCGLVCAPNGPNGTTGQCAYPCNSTPDCPLPYTTCQAGLCLDAPCEPISGNGQVGGSCDSSDAGDGTCLASSSRSGAAMRICLQGGLVFPMGGCSIYADRGDPSDLCPVGMACYATDSSGEGTCRTVCDVGSPNPACPFHMTCQLVDEGFASFGLCL